MKPYRSLWVGLAVAGAMTAIGYAQNDPTEVPDHKLSEWKLGDSISGEAVKLSDLKGKVVAIEYWGIN